MLSVVGDGSVVGVSAVVVDVASVVVVIPDTVDVVSVLVVSSVVVLSQFWKHSSKLSTINIAVSTHSFSKALSDSVEGHGQSFQVFI